MKTAKFTDEQQAWIDAGKKTMVGVTLTRGQHQRLRAHLVTLHPEDSISRLAAPFLRALMLDNTEPYSVVEKGGA